MVIYDYVSGEGLSYTKVKINGITYRTDTEGEVAIPCCGVDTLVIESDTYVKFVDNSITLYSEDRMPIGLMRDVSYQQPITKVILQEVGDTSGKKINILRQKVTYDENTTKKCNVTIKSTADEKEVSKYVIKLDGRILFESKTGVFKNVPMSKFKTYGYISAIIVYKDGTKSRQIDLMIHMNY